MKKFLCFAIVFLLVFSNLNIYSSPLQIDKPGKAPIHDDRPSVALVLSGGGARGYAQIPILKMIEEVGIPIDMVIGTSIGAIVGSLYSSGYSPEKIEECFKGIQWSKIFNDNDIYDNEEVLGNHSLYKIPVSGTLGKDFSLKLGSGFSDGQKVYELLKKYTLKVPSYIDYDNLHIPFRAVAADVLEGSTAVFHDEDVAEAVRASMSLPGVFDMFEIDEHYYMDGGIKYAIPTTVVKNMGYDIVIVIDVTPKLPTKAEEYEGNLSVAVTNINVTALVDRDSECFNSATLGLAPDLSKYSIMDFDKNDEIYEAGEKCAIENKNKLDEVRRLIYPDDYTEDGKRISPYNKRDQKSYYDSLPEIKPESLKIEGAYSQDINYINKSFNDTCKDELSVENINKFIDRINYIGNYKTFLFRMDEKENCLHLVLRQKENQSFKVGMTLGLEQTVSQTVMTSFSLSPVIQYRDLNGTLLSLKFSCFDTLGVDFLWHTQFNPDTFFKTNISYNKSINSIYDIANNNISLFQSNSIFNANINIASRNFNNFNFSAGAFFKYIDVSDSTISVDTELNNYCNDNGINISSNESNSTCVSGLSIASSYNSLNSNTLATSGFCLDVVADAFCNPLNFSFDEISVVPKINVKGVAKLSEKFSVSCSGFFGTDILNTMTKNPIAIVNEGFSLYDRIFFPHITKHENFGVHKAALNFVLQFQPFSELTIIGGELFLRLCSSVGNVSYNMQDLINTDSSSAKSLVWSTSFDVGLKLTKDFSIIVRAGSGSTRTQSIVPFFALDIGSIKF